MKKTVTHIYFASILTGALLFLSTLSFASITQEADSIPKRGFVHFLKHQAIDSLMRDSLRLSRDSIADIRLDSIQPVLQDSELIDTTVPFIGNEITKSTGNTRIIDTDTAEVYITRNTWAPSPQRATILSAVLPGLGQAYNRRYWKIPIIYTAGAALYYGYQIKDKEFTDAKIAYNTFKATGFIPDGENANSLVSNRDFARQRRDYFVIYMGILYVANVVDAMTDAYFRQYDMSEDLTISFKPAITPTPAFASMDINCGLKISLKF